MGSIHCSSSKYWKKGCTSSGWRPATSASRLIGWVSAQSGRPRSKPQPACAAKSPSPVQSTKTFARSACLPDLDSTTGMREAGHPARPPRPAGDKVSPSRQLRGTGHRAAASSASTSKALVGDPAIPGYAPAWCPAGLNLWQQPCLFAESRIQVKQPLVHIPPRQPCISTRQVRAPVRALARAAATPAGPPPHTRTSNSSLTSQALRFQDMHHGHYSPRATFATVTREPSSTPIHSSVKGSPSSGTS